MLTRTDHAERPTDTGNDAEREGQVDEIIERIERLAAEAKRMHDLPRVRLRVGST